MYTMFITTPILATLILSCSSTYDTIDDILTQIHKFEFNKFERDNGIAAILLDFSVQVMQRPIEFKVGGFYCLTQPLLVSVKEEQVFFNLRNYTKLPFFLYFRSSLVF